MTVFVCSAWACPLLFCAKACRVCRYVLQCIMHRPASEMCGDVTLGEVLRHWVEVALRAVLG